MINRTAITPESLGISSEALLKLMKRLSKIEYINSIQIMRHGRTCLEAYVEPYSPDEPHQLFSLSKSFTSCAVGLAQQAGLLDIHDKLVKYFPEYNSNITDERMRKVTLQDLLTMRSGHLSCATKYFTASNDWCRAFFASQLDCEPGTVFTYNSAASYMLAAAVKKVTGMNVREYLMKPLFEPLKIAPGIWESSPQGINYGGWGLYLTTESLAKFGQLLLQKGRWQGQQLLPADYLAEAVQKQADNSSNIPPDWKLGYGYQFWRSQYGYRGDGAAGQYVLVLDEFDMVIAITSCMSNMQDILTAVWEELIFALTDSPLPEAPEDCRELRDFCSKLHIPPLEGDLTRRRERAFFEFIENPQGIKSCEAVFGENDCTLTFHGPHGIEQLRAGFGKLLRSTLQLTDPMAHPTLASAAWQDDHTLEICTFIADGIYRDRWIIDFNDPAEPLKLKVICACFRPERPRFLLKK